MLPPFRHAARGGWTHEPNAVWTTCTAPRWKADELRIPSMYDLPTADENFCALHAYEHTVSYFRIAISAEKWWFSSVSAGELSSSDTNLFKYTCNVHLLLVITVSQLNTGGFLNIDSEFLTGVASYPLLNFHTNLHTKSGVACYPRSNLIEALVLLSTIIDRDRG